jgi:hypothetical protein
MVKYRFILALSLLIFCSKLFSQNFLITEPKLEFDGYKLQISYDLISKGPSDIFSVWVEIWNQAGKPIKAYSFAGEVGDSVKAGSNKKITWIPEDDAVYLDEDVSVELKAEKFVRSFNKGGMLALSTVMPGLGQTKIKNGKPWWLTSIPAYGTLAGGLLVHKMYNNTYAEYLKATDAVERSDLYDQSQKDKSISGALLISSAVLWVSNIIWVAATPNNYKPLQHAKVSLNSVPFNKQRYTMLSFRIEF